MTECNEDENHSWRAVSCPGFLSTRDMDVLDAVQRSATKMIKGLEQLTYIGRWMALELFNLEESRFSKDVIHIYTFRWCAKVEPGPLQWCPLTGPEALSTDWNMGMSSWLSGNIVKVADHWHRVYREAEQSHNLEILKTCLDIVLSIQLCLSRGVGADDLQKCLQTSNTLCESIKSSFFPSGIKEDIYYFPQCHFISSILSSANPYR